MGYCSPRDWLSEIWGHVVWYSNIVIWALVTQCFFFFLKPIGFGGFFSSTYYCSLVISLKTGVQNLIT